METPKSPGPLAGIRVLDLTRALSGPFATMILGDLGADVIKVEDIWHGDDTRRWGPPFQGDDAAYFLSINRNKRGLSVNLKAQEGRQVVQALARSSDIVIENFRPGTAARLGLGYEELSAQNPALIYASISGYGQTGPDAGLPGYDAVAQAVSGMMSVTGEASGEPVRSGTSLADVGAGMWALIGILAALHARQATGRGQLIDVSLLDGQVAWLTYVAGKYFTTGVTPGRYGSAHESLAPYQVFQTADEPLMVAVGSDGLWRRFTAATGLDELTDDSRYATNPDRVRNRDTLIPRITKALAARGCAEWTDLLNEAGVPAGPVNTVPAALAQPQVAAREMVVELEHPVAGMLKMLGTPLKLSAQPASIRRPPPVLGQHTDEILGEAGYPAERIAALREAGVIRLRQPAQLQKAAKGQQVADAGLDLDPARYPHAGDVGRGRRQRYHVVAAGGQPDVGLRLIGRGLLDRLRAVTGNPGHERNAQIGDVAAERAAAEEAGPVLLGHLAQSVGKGLQRLAALLGCGHRAPRSCQHRTVAFSRRVAQMTDEHPDARSGSRTSQQDARDEDQNIDAERAVVQAPQTGDGRVDDAVAGLSRLPGRPASEHVAILEEVHGRLRDILDELAEGTEQR
jgi:crotonobetainyl-CoA:carnitine CoA-transferase CaiB-like acyl-CoA transferase